MADSTLSTVASGLPIVGGVISGLLNNASNKAIANDNRVFAEHMYDRQRVDSLNDWERQNAYNSPAAQMKRYEDARLNKNLIYGSATNNVAQPVRASSATVPQAHGSDYSAIAHGAAASGQLLQSGRQMELNNTIALQEVALKAAQTGADIALKGKQSDVSDQTAKNLIQEYSQKKDLFPYQMDHLREEVRKTSGEADIALTEVERREASTASSLREAAERILNMRAEREKVPAEKARIEAETKRLLSSDVLQNLDIGLKKNGVQPHDNLFFRILSKYINQVQTNNSDAMYPGFDLK